ncbi:autophagy protein 12 [Holotrichia oblita]|uniref:Autophagy protein 12 n=2 Tax=Holotrichia oblita TaxID=644536 RepID=A0ACB9T9P5_HOLOL|nr:autophagy protein 12 [Holotrichia oblita]
MSEGNQNNDGNNCESLNSTTGDTNENSKGVDKEDKEKIDIYLRPTGNAPIMKHKKWSVEADKPIGWIIDFMRKYLKLDPQERLFLYINQTFAPSPDQTVRNLYDCYNTEGKLVLHYCKSQAWGK